MSILDRLPDWLRYLGDTDMSKADRARWASASSLADIGDLTVEWLYGGIIQTPSHGGPPDPETIPHLDVLAAANRAGFVTTNSQSASAPEDVAEYGEWGAYVQGFASEETLERLRGVIAGTGLIIAGARRRAAFGPDLDGARWQRRCWRTEVGFYIARCPAAADEIAAAWWAEIRDSQEGSNDRLWPALLAFAKAAPDPLPAARFAGRRGREGSTDGAACPCVLCRRAG